MSAKTYTDRVKCPQGHKFSKLRRVGSAGRKVSSCCRLCSRAYQLKAGPLPKEKP